RRSWPTTAMRCSCGGWTMSPADGSRPRRRRARQKRSTAIARLSPASGSTDDPEKFMTPQTGHAALILATGFAGLLAGASADRYLVQVPAWRHLDVMTWAEHSRHADLGNGRFWYPALALGSTGLSIVAVIAVTERALSVQGLLVPVSLAALLSFVGLGMTVLAAPNLLRLRHSKGRATT